MQGFVDSESIFDMINHMTTTAIICELNPLHLGHSYIVKKAREITGADFVVALMSGNFVQRGEPAVFDKFTRTKSALLNGFDAVFELPVVSATASAEFFARGAVSLIDSTGVFDYLCFGSETGELIDIDSIDQRPDKDTITKAFRNGKTYADALDSDSLLSGPNDLLGVEYQRALRGVNSNVSPVAIKRIDCPHASEIRKNLMDFKGMPSTEVECFASSLPVFPDDISALLNYRLLDFEGGFDAYFDCTLELSNRIRKEFEMTPFSTMVDKLKSRNYTRSRISRTLLHIILGITDELVSSAFDDGGINYLRLLGMKKSAGELLRQIKEFDFVPVITKPSDYKTINSQQVKKCFELDLRASQIYRQIVFAKYSVDIGSDISSSPIIDIG